ncbi:multidrug DMT transporter permease [Polaromonas sp. CT11-55]|uniref:multidrug DMT transporter permease n=1 Tax=Polaromonas sp. CT11-55 TaxID=3243045 RepID=UPI0039A48B04
MQELAVRLGEPASRAETQTALLQFLRSRKLEAEVVEGLCIFWMAARGRGYSPVAELASSIPKPSLLSDLYLDDLGLSPQAGGAGLKEAPEDFEIPDDFDRVQGVDLPRMFRTALSRLEDSTGLSFVRQMAYEWAENRAAYPDAPYQGDPWHFTRSLGDGFSGQLSARAALRAISAYLRTLAVAKQFWGMPADLAGERALLALPVHPTLALLRPRRPDWFPGRTDFDGDAVSVEAALRALLDRVKTVQPDGELIAFSSPVVMSMGQCVEVSLVRWSQAVGSQVEDADLGAHLKAFWRRGQALPSAGLEPLRTTTILAPPPLERLAEVKSKAWPMAGTLDFDRLGYLQLDLYPSRLFLPTLPGVDQMEVTPRDGQLEVKAEGQVIADFGYWNAGWGPARPRQLSGNCGSALISRGTVYRESVGSEGEMLRAFYLWQVRTLHRSGSFDEFSETLAMGTFFV